VPWLARVAWLTLPATTGAALGDALDGRSDPVVAVAVGLAWATWAAVLLALLVPRPPGLVLFRVGAAAALAATAWAAVVAGGPGWVVAAAVPAVISLLPAVGEWQVNGAAYGDERRYLLRVPGAVLLGPLALAAVVAAGGIVAGPLLLAARQWVVGGLALVAGWPAAYVAGRALAGLTRRWVVLVPAGLVVKDDSTLLDPLLFRRPDIARLGPAPADTPAVDLTAGAFGLALELRLATPYKVVRVGPDRRPVPDQLEALLVTPTRPGALVADAARRRIPTGAP
jgi:hypothetical protein